MGSSRSSGFSSCSCEDPSDPSSSSADPAKSGSSSSFGAEEAGRIAPWPQVNDGAVLLEVDASPVPDRDVLARCKGTLTSNMHAPIFHGEETCIEGHDHISGIAPLASTRGVQLRHIAVSDAVDSVVGAFTVIADGLVLDRSTFYVEPIHPEWHHLVECLGNHIRGDRKTNRALVEQVLIPFTKCSVISVRSDLKRPYRRYAGGTRQQSTLLVTNDGDDDLEHSHPTPSSWRHVSDIEFG